MNELLLEVGESMIFIIFVHSNICDFMYLCIFNYLIMYITQINIK